jgi:ATP-dependent exoDNAse (exonuclease V) beta subunit
LGATIDTARKSAAAGRGDVPEHLRPVPVDSGARRQFSVSRLHGTLRTRKAEAVNDDDEVATAATTLDPLGLGTLVHAVLAELATAKDDSRAMIESLVRKHACVHLPDAGTELEEPIELIAALTATTRWASLRAAGHIHAELEFLLSWPPGNAAEVGVYIQGFIDCLYQGMSGEWRLLDYKTNRVTPESLSGVVESYEMQMLVYALAAERVLKQPLAEIVLHFLRGGHEHRFVWNEAARQKAVKLVSGALRSAADPNAVTARV